MSNKVIGKQGEDIACEYITKLGYKIIGRNIHFSKYCELDILGVDKDTLVAIEVKTRSNNICGHPLEAITKNKYNNIKTGLFLYLKENPQYKKFRIDAVSVLLSPNTEIKHLKNI